MNYTEAITVAESLVQQFRGGCDRIEVQGGLRRREQEIHEINLLAIPKADWIFATILHPKPQSLEHMLTDMQSHDEIEYEKIGERSKRFWLISSGISVQLYLVLPPATWGVKHVFGTGPDKFVHWMMKTQRYGGAIPNHCRVKHGSVWDRKSGQKYETPEEVDFFRLCGLDWIAPEARAVPGTK
jgi:DNA polymerase/3'-5' exonuclease PolX